MINNVFPQIVRCLLLPLLAGAAVLPAWSQGKPAAASPQAEEPSTQILSNTLHYDEVKKLSTFKGNVVMTRGLLTMTAEKLELREDSQGFSMVRPPQIPASWFRSARKSLRILRCSRESANAPITTAKTKRST